MLNDRLLRVLLLLIAISTVLRFITNYLVTVAQLVEPRIVIPVVVGSIPISHPSLCYLIELNRVCARVAELVDALDLGSSVLRRESSSLSSRTIQLDLIKRVLV